MAQHERQGGDDTLALLGLLLLLLGGGSALLWYAFHAEIATAVIAVQRGMIAAASPFTDRYDLLDKQLAGVDPAHPSVTLERLYNLAHNVGAFYRIPAALILALLAVACFRRVGTAQFRRRFDLNALMREHAKNYRFTTAFVGRNLGAVLPASGRPRPADPTLHLEEWVARFARREDGAYDDTGARHELAQQLGPVWMGRAAAAPHVRCLFAVFSLHAARRREEAIDLLGDMAEGLPIDPKDGPAGPAAPLTFPATVIAKADRLLLDPAVSGPCDKVATVHAFTHTAMMSVLTFARERAGVLNPGMFAFLQLVDRQLYLSLDALGFPVMGVPWHRSAAQANYIEADGVKEHWVAECSVGRPLFVPQVDASAGVIRAMTMEYDARKHAPKGQL